MATPPKATVAFTGLAWQLVQEKLIEEEAVKKAMQEAQKEKLPLVQYLVEKGLVDAMVIAITASNKFGVPLLDLDAMDSEEMPLDLVKEDLIRKHHVLPLYKRGNRLFIALSDPTQSDALRDIRFSTGSVTEAILVEENKLTAAIERVLKAKETSTMDDMMDDVDLDNFELVEEAEQTEEEGDLNVDEAPIVRYINKILRDAIQSGTSDIHFEPYEKFFRVRYRQDGLLQEVARPASNLAPRLTARLKVMSRMNIAEKRVPQDGRIKLKLSKTRSVDFRVNTLPTLYGEKVCLRILDSSAATVGVEKLGFEPEQREAFETAIKRPYGMILVTGPTGSGKTVSLYTGLNMLNTPEVNISTAEDPVEIQVAGINQVNVNQAAGLTFAEALRSFLRQDPDIVMVGEIRDLETAEIAVKAAQTGHLVLSTLHTNDAPQTLTRLANMGIPPFNIASSVLLIMAQRLARRLCPSCKRPEEIPAEALKLEGFTDEDIEEGFIVYRPNPDGCERCNRGYKGRVGIFQVMPISDAMTRLILENGTSIQLADQARSEGIADLRQSGLRKVKAGVTSLEELNRVTKD